ncbi:MAG: phosphate ABC transporter permease [Sulfobacillus acidophilus]|uniref:Phosphate ABC transporter permease n=1 Tax=Sulfobacillus acidophilus TaxID=53633 RepID=A0A2T2WJ91_9FIRM|nr:MAG: phosphate ABC transporter permease [Sulfobacillus acidophilus]
MVLHLVALVLTGVAAALFALIIVSLVRQGLPSLTWRFLVGSPNERAGDNGIAPELMNTAFLIGVTWLVTAPLGLLVAIFLREYGFRRRSAVVRPLNHLRATLLSAPTVVVALVVYRVAVGWWHWPVSLATGCLTLAVINWPFMVTVAEQALASVPQSYREASLGLGATRFATAVRVVIPAALSPLIEGWGLAVARLAGESAALVITAGVNVSRHFSLWGPGETLAVHIWYIRTEGVSVNRDAEAAATGVILLLLIAAVVWSSARVARMLSGGEPR